MSAVKNSAHPLVGCFFRKKAYTYRVMAVHENYAMMRAKGCVPFVVYLKELKRDYVRVVRPRHGLRHCCGRRPIQNVGAYCGMSYFEVACPVCRRRTGIHNCWADAFRHWNLWAASNWSTDVDKKFLSKRSGYQVQSKEWPWEFVRRPAGNS